MFTFLNLKTACNLPTRFVSHVYISHCTVKFYAVAVPGRVPFNFLVFTNIIDLY